MDTTMLQDLLMQNAEAVFRAAQRSARGLRSLEGAGGPIRRLVLQEFMVDSQADLASLVALRKTAGLLLAEGIEAR